MFGTQQPPDNTIGLASLFTSAFNGGPRHNPMCACHICQGPNNDGFNYGPSTGPPGRFCAAGVQQETKKPKVDEFKGYKGRLFESPCGRKMICTYVTSSILHDHLIIKFVNLKNFDEYIYNEETVMDLTPLPEDPNMTILSVLADKTRFDKAKFNIIHMAKMDAQIEEHRKTIQEIEAKIKELELNRKQLSTQM